MAQYTRVSMNITVLVDGVERARIEWEGSVEGVLPDDIRFARKLKANVILWKELIAKRIAGTSFDGRVYTVYTKTGKGGSVLAAPAAKMRSRVLETDHPFLEACDERDG